MKSVAKVSKELWTTGVLFETPERSFSARRTVKTYMRSSMGVERLSGQCLVSFSCTLTETGTSTHSKSSKIFVPRKCVDWHSNFDHLHRITET